MILPLKPWHVYKGYQIKLLLNTIHILQILKIRWYCMAHVFQHVITLWPETHDSNFVSSEIYMSNVSVTPLQVVRFEYLDILIRFS